MNELKEQLGMYEVLLESTTLGPSSSTPFTEQNVNSKLHEFGMFKTPISRYLNGLTCCIQPSTVLGVTKFTFI